MRLQIFFTKGFPNESHWKHTNALLKKLPERVIASSETAESSSSVKRKKSMMAVCCSKVRRMEVMKLM